MNMKKVIAAVLAAASVLSLAGCGNNETPGLTDALTSNTDGTSSKPSTTIATGSTSSKANGTSSAEESNPEESSAASTPEETDSVQVDWSTVPELDEMDIDYEVKEAKDIANDLQYVFGLNEDVKKNGMVIITAYYGDAEYIKLPQTIAGKSNIAVKNDTRDFVNWGDNAKAIKYPDGFVSFFSRTSKLSHCGGGKAPNVTSVSLPDNLEYITLFNGLQSLEEITLPTNLKTIEQNAFAGCEKLKSGYLRKGY